MHERIEDPIFRGAVELLDSGDAEGLRAHLRAHPDVARAHVDFEGGNYFQHPTLLEFVAENPVRHGSLPRNIVEMAGVILDAGADRPAMSAALGLVASGRVPRECGVQTALIELLCRRGADPQGALLPALGEHEFEAAEALLRCGAKLDLPAAAALGRTPEAEALLPSSEPAERHRALALSAQHGRTAIVRLLLDAGEDPRRYNPAGCHAHSTPLHQAAYHGHADVVRLLVERGADLEVRDSVFDGRPADWARHAGRLDIEAYLRGIAGGPAGDGVPAP